ncbi:hypothetical protein DFH09DRAFT_923369 [Mycena vulgaris]|nr:hypothetical protein DFH09DRAFT_923369 [Mycena vulgaris]
MSTTWEKIEGEILARPQIVGRKGTGDEIVEWILKVQADVKATEPGTFAYIWARHGDTFTTWERCGYTPPLSENSLGGKLPADLLTRRH